ncbi:MAG: hypothetical protein LUE98_13815 [Tannerellaceae bacterium]|nr:hypothetical protein [Tannerellaceae bacterium]
MKNYLFPLMALFLLVISCEKESGEPKITIEDSTVFEFTYTGEHEIKDFNVFIGPEGNKLESESALANQFWGEQSLLGQPYYTTLIVDKSKDSIYLKDIYSHHQFLLQLSNDTLQYESNNREYWGVFSNDSTFIMNRAHYFIHYDGRETDYNDYSQVGHYGYWRNYEKAKKEEFFHENSKFRSLQDMTFPSDTIAWLTEYYEFKLTKSY